MRIVAIQEAVTIIMDKLSNPPCDEWIAAPAQPHWQNQPDPAIVNREGAGRWRICQVMLACRVAANPVAGLFARRLTERTLQ